MRWMRGAVPCARRTRSCFASGAIIEREVPSQINYEELTDIDFVLDEPDFTTAVRLAKAVNASLGEDVARARTASTVSMQLPASMQGRFPEFAAAVEDVSLEMDSTARVVINERTGTVVMGGEVTISASPSERRRRGATYFFFIFLRSRDPSHS